MQQLTRLHPGIEIFHGGSCMARVPKCLPLQPTDQYVNECMDANDVQEDEKSS